MDERLFADYLADCKCVSESTSYLEIFNYTDPAARVHSSHKLDIRDTDFRNFVARKGAFEPQVGKDGATFSNGIRLVLHPEAEHVSTFMPKHISFPVGDYEAMVRGMKLPFRAVETSSVVGPFFWWTIKKDAASSETLLQMVFRKSDVQWKGTPRGWEMILSYSFGTQITSGYVKGTSSAEINPLLEQLDRCTGTTSHPLLLPLLMLDRQLGSSNDESQRTNREAVRQLEVALTGRYGKVTPAKGYKSQKDLDLDALGRDITDCQSRNMWKRPQAWRGIVTRMETLSSSFWKNLDDGRKDAMRETHEEVLSRLDFLEGKLDGLENYVHVSLERLQNQREVVNSLLSQREWRLSLAISLQQKRLADASKRDSSSMKMLAMLGSLFLPGTFVASIFSMPFFSFSQDLDGNVSKSFWVYWVITVPLTIAVFCVLQKLEKRSYHEVDKDSDQMKSDMINHEKLVMSTIREATGAHVRTFPYGEKPSEPADQVFSVV